MADVMCDWCGRERTEYDHDYSALQVISGRPIGWYSGDDGELCPQCIAKTIDGGERNAKPLAPWRIHRDDDGDWWVCRQHPTPPWREQPLCETVQMFRKGRDAITTFAAGGR